MPDPSVGGEAGRAVGYTGLGVLLLKGADFLMKRAGTNRTAQAEELDATMRTAGAIRAELRLDNEALRHRVAELESENAKLRDINDKLDEIHGIVNSGRTRMLAHVALLSKHIALLMPDDSRAQFAADVAKAEADDALANAPAQAAPR